MAVVDDVREALEQTVRDFSDRSGDWAAVLAMAQTGEGDGRGRAGASQGRRRRLLVALAAVALVAVVTASAFAVRAIVFDNGFSGLPPAGATPSTPESGVLEMFYWVSDARGRTRNWVYADGRLIRLGIRRDNGTPLPGLREQRLTRRGVELLRAEIISAGGFGQAQPPPGSRSLHGVERGMIQVRKGDRLVPLTWASNLKRLEARLTDPESWLPASAWKQRKIKAAYVPSRFEVCIGLLLNDPQNLSQMNPARIVALLPKAAQNVLRGRDWSATARTTSTGFYSRCFAVTTEGARSLAKALEGAGPAEKGRLSFTFNAPGPSRQVWISFSPYFPHGGTTCLPCG